MIKDRLRLLSANETRGEATDVFKCIHCWRCSVPGPPTTDTPVRIYEMAKDCTFRDMFGGFGVGLDSLALITFVTRSRPTGQ